MYIMQYNLESDSPRSLNEVNASLKSSFLRTKKRCKDLGINFCILFLGPNAINIKMSMVLVFLYSWF